MANKQTSPDDRLERVPREQMPLLPSNFRLMAIAGILIVAGFVLMAGGATGDTFNPDIFSVRRIILGPGIAFIGFIFMGYAIMFNRKKK